jgi:hypothetical protein
MAIPSQERTWWKSISGANMVEARVAHKVIDMLSSFQLAGVPDPRLAIICRVAALAHPINEVDYT